MGAFFQWQLLKMLNQIGLKTGLVCMLMMFQQFFFQFKFIISTDKEIAYVCICICSYSCTENAG